MSAGRGPVALRACGAVALSLAVGLTACEKHEFEPPDREEQMREARAAFTPAMFDTITWPSDSIRAIDGNVVFSTYCRNCHGPLGAGGTDYARERDLEVPSLVVADWPYAEEPDSVLERIFVGHLTGMPTWGVAGLTFREMDAVTHYLLDVLRPEVLESGSGTSPGG